MPKVDRLRSGVGGLRYEIVGRVTALPQAWNVPAHNPNFTGRGRELAALAEGLAAGSTVTVRGLGGVGKTQLAAEYAHARAGDYEVVWEIAAEEPASIADQFTELAARLGLRPEIVPEKLQAQVRDRLRAAAGWLLIFDDADRVEEIQPWLPGGAPSPAGSGHVIVTTRGGFSAPGPAMDLDVIDVADAVRLLRYRVPDLDQAAGEQIAGELGRLPLALEQAAAYLDHAGVPGEEYLGLLRGQADDLAQRGQVGLLTDMIAALWRISLDRVAAEDPAAIQLLEICACLAPEPVPLDLLTAHAELLPEPLSSTVAGDQVAFAETMALLVDYSLARRSLAGLQLHRLVQGAIRSRYDSLSPPADGAPLAVAMGLLCADAPAQTMDTWPVPPRWAVLLPHVLAATGRVDRAASQAGSASLADASWLLDQAGIYLRSRAQPAEARPLLERALAFVEAVHGPDHPEVAAVLNDLALVLRDLGQPEAARPLLERAEAMERGRGDRQARPEADA